MKQLLRGGHRLFLWRPEVRNKPLWQGLFRYETASVKKLQKNDDLSQYLSYGTYTLARESLDRYIDHLLAKSLTPIDRETVYREFIWAHASADWKTVAKRINQTLGPGSFAALGRASEFREDGDKKFASYVDMLDSYDAFVDYLSQNNPDATPRDIYQILKAERLSPAALHLTDIDDEVTPAARHGRVVTQESLSAPLLQKAFGEQALVKWENLRRDPASLRYRMRCWPGFNEFCSCLAKKLDIDEAIASSILREAQVTPLDWPVTEKTTETDKWQFLQSALLPEELAVLKQASQGKEAVLWGRLQQEQNLLSHDEVGVRLNDFMSQCGFDRRFAPAIMDHLLEIYRENSPTSVEETLLETFLDRYWPRVQAALPEFARQTYQEVMMTVAPETFDQIQEIFTENFINDCQNPNVRNEILDLVKGLYPDVAAWSFLTPVDVRRAFGFKHDDELRSLNAQGVSAEETQVLLGEMVEVQDETSEQNSTLWRRIKNGIKDILLG